MQDRLSTKINNFIDDKRLKTFKNNMPSAYGIWALAIP